MKNLQIQTAGSAGLYDLSMLEEMEDTDYLLDVLGILLMETPVEFKEMLDALQAGKTDIVCIKAHKLKSSAGVIQAKKLTVLLEDIETIGKKGVINHELICLVDNAAHEYNSIERALKVYVEELSS